MRKMFVSVLLAALSITGMSSAGEKNSEDGSQYRPYALGEVVVSARKTGSEEVGTLSRVTAEDIRNSGARTLDEAIDLIPGVYVRIGNSGTPRVDIRGFRTRHVILLLDGIPFNSTYDGQFDPTSIPVENIAEIKVTTGAGSLLYGPGGNGGIINIITQKGRDGVHGTAHVEAGSENAYIGRFTVSGAGDKFDAFLSGSLYDKEGFPLSDDFHETAYEDGGRRKNSDFERKNLNANFGYSVSDRTMIGLSAGHQEGENGVPSVVNYDKDDPFTKKPKYDRLDDLDGNAFQLAFSHAAKSRFSTRGWVYLNEQDLSENRYDDETYATQAANGAYSSDSTSRIFGANLQGSMDLNDLGFVTLALITETHDWEADGFEVDKKGNELTFEEEEDFNVHTLSLEYGVSPVDKLDVVVGCGYHRMNKDEGGDENASSWLLGTGYDLFDKTRLKASYAHKIRFPSIRDLYDPGSGNRELEAEKTDHYEIGITQGLSPDADVSLTLFRIDAESFIEKDIDGISRNFEDYRFSGVEIAGEARLLDSLTLRASYTYLDSENESDNTEMDELQYRPKHKYGLETTYAVDFGLMLHGDILMVRDQYFYNDDSPRLKKSLDNFTLINLKISQLFFKNALEAYLGSDNILDENYEQSYGLPQAGRTVYGGMAYRF